MCRFDDQMVPLHIFVHACTRAWVCVCVCEREREREMFTLPSYAL
jgi:hypothetical protein